MKMELLNNSQLKILVCKEELDCFCVTYDTLSEKSTETQKMLKSLMEMARSQTGFEFCNCRLIIEAEPSKDGGLNLLITKTPSTIELFHIKDGYRLKNTRGCLKTNILQTLIFRFDSFDDMTDYCCHSKTSKDILLSSLYKLDGLYYMVLSIPIISSQGNETFEKIKSILSEYGDLVTQPHFDALLSEHGDAIILANAIESIRKAFSFHH